MQNDIVVFSKNILDSIKAGQNKPNQELADMCAVLLYITENIETTTNVCDWMYCKKDVDGFIDNVQQSMHLITDMSDTSADILELVKKHRKGILDHHFWNDVDVEWAHCSTGLYGNNYGEDILIKLIALSEGKVGAGEIK